MSTEKEQEGKGETLKKRGLTVRVKTLLKWIEEEDSDALHINANDVKEFLEKDDLDPDTIIRKHYSFR